MTIQPGRRHASRRPPSPANFLEIANMWTANDKLKCVRRELQYRIRVYARMVTEGKLTERQAGREIAIMAAIVEDYKDLAHAETPQLALDGGKDQHPEHKE